MKTFLKIIAGIVLVVVLLLAAAAVYVKFFFDPNDLRAQITEQVHKRTGRDLLIDGDFTLKTFPWLEINIGRTRLSDDPAFGNDTLMAFDSASASIKLRPLLSKRIELGTTSIEGLNLTLIRKADGATNWNAFLESLAPSDAKPEAPPVDGKPGFAAETLGALNVINATLRYTDEALNETMTVSQLNLRTGDLVPGQPFDVDLATLLNATNVALDIRLTGNMQTSETQIELNRLEAAVSGTHYALPFADFAVALKSPAVTLGETTATLATPVIEWQVSGGREAAASVSEMSGTFSAARLARNDARLDLEAPQLVFAGTLENGPVSAMNGEFSGTELSVSNNTELTMPAPKFTGTFKGDGVPGNNQSVTITSQQLTLDLDKGALGLAAYQARGLDLDVTGDLQVGTLFDTPTVRSPLQVAAFNPRKLMKALNIDLETSDATALTNAAGKATVRMDAAGFHMDKLAVTLDGSQVNGNVSLGTKGPRMVLNIDVLDMDRYLPPPDPADAADREVDAIEIPAQTLRELNLNGDFKVGKLTFGGIESQNVVVSVASDNGKVRVHPASAQLYGGTYTGDMRIDASGEVPELSMNERFDNVDFGALSKDIAGTDRVSGRITGALTMTARGHNTSDLKASSNGTTSFSIANGVLEGVNLMETVRNIVALANKQPTKPDEPDRTEFRKLAGTATIRNGVLLNDDLTIEVPLLRVTGGGSLNLNNKKIDYKIGTRVVQEGDVPLEKELQFLTDYNLPVFISGTYDAPLIDKTASVADLVKQYAKKRVTDKIFDRLGLGTKEQPVPGADTAGTGEPGEQVDPAAAPPAEEEPPKKPKDVLKDKLKDLIGGGG